jgi:hypothetical protein
LPDPEILKINNSQCGNEDQYGYGRENFFHSRKFKAMAHKTWCGAAIIVYLTKHYRLSENKNSASKLSFGDL